MSEILTWDDLWKQEEQAPAPKSNPSKARCSKLAYLKGCTNFDQDSGSNYHSTRGRVLHKIMETGVMPADTPRDEKYLLAWADNGIKQLEKEGWRIFGKEVYLENERLTGNLDLVMIQGDQYLVCDYKFGFIEKRSDDPQLAGNAELIYSNYPDADLVSTTIIQPEHLEMGKSMFIYDWTPETCRGEVSLCLEKKVAPCHACAYCDKNGTCEALELATNEMLEMMK